MTAETCSALEYTAQRRILDIEAAQIFDLNWLVKETWRVLTEQAERAARSEIMVNPDGRKYDIHTLKLIHRWEARCCDIYEVRSITALAEPVEAQVGERISGCHALFATLDPEFIWDGVVYFCGVARQFKRDPQYTGVWVRTA